MSAGGRPGRFRPSTIADDDWLIDGRPVIADAPTPQHVLQVDRFVCIECGEPLTVVLDVAQDDDASTARRIVVADVASLVQADVQGVAPCSRRVACASCGTEQVALAASGEIQSERWVTVAIGTVDVRSTGRRAANVAAAAVLGVVLLAVLGSNLSAAFAYRNARLDVRDGARVDAVVVSASERGSAASVVASHSLRVTFSIQSLEERTIEVDKATFLRYADADEVPIYVRGHRATVAGDHEQRNDLFELLAIDAVILAAIVGAMLVVRASARDARRDPHA